MVVVRCMAIWCDRERAKLIAPKSECMSRSTPPVNEGRKGEGRREKGERRKEKGERRKKNGERRKEKGEREKGRNGEREKWRKGEGRKREGRKGERRRQKGEREKGEWRKEYPSIRHPAQHVFLWRKTRCEARKWAKDEPGKYASSLWGFAHHDTNYDSAKPKERTSREERAARARGTQAWRRPVRRRRKSRG